MKIRMDMDHDGKKKGEVYEVTDAEGCSLIGQAVCSTVELDPVPSETGEKKKRLGRKENADT